MAKGSFFMSKRERRQHSVLVFRTTHKDAVKETAKTDKATKTKRKKELAAASEVCQLERTEARKKVSATCAARRGKIRGRAHAALGKTKARRKGTRKEWTDESRRYRKGEPLLTGERKYSRSESDAIAKQGIDPRYHKYFMHTRQSYPYTRQPDARSELFNEWLSSDEGSQSALEFEMKTLPTDLQYARAYRASQQHQAAHEPELLEVAPF